MAEQLSLFPPDPVKYNRKEREPLYCDDMRLGQKYNRKERERLYGVLACCKSYRHRDTALVIFRAALNVYIANCARVGAEREDLRNLTK